VLLRAVEAMLVSSAVCIGPVSPGIRIGGAGGSVAIQATRPRWDQSPESREACSMAVRWSAPDSSSGCSKRAW
jgi:hypothetical protein